MKTNFTYNPDLSGLVIIKDPQIQWNEFFTDGHPKFLIPDFNSTKVDIWLSFIDYLEKNSKNIYDQDGGEIISNSVINTNTGLTECAYLAYGIMFDTDDESFDYKVKIEGYVVKSQNETYFVATKVNIEIL